MARFLLLLCALAIGGIATLIYLDATHFDTSNTTAVPNEGLAAMAPAEFIAALDDTDRQKHAAAFQRDSKIPPPTPAVTQKITSKQISRWITQTSDENPAVRAAAIDALSNAPKTKAMPVLLNVMRAGEDGDRQLALDSLHTLALQQGDDNDAIRTALRLVIYDGEEGAMISNAQIALEDIEYGLVPPSPVETPRTNAPQ